MDRRTGNRSNGNDTGTDKHDYLYGNGNSKRLYEYGGIDGNGKLFGTNGDDQYQPDTGDDLFRQYNYTDG